jgi:hypothetical protein
MSLRKTMWQVHHVHLGMDHLIFDGGGGGGGVDFQFARYFFPPPDTVRFFLSVSGLARYFFVCMYIHFLVFCFYIFWYKL